MPADARNILDDAISSMIEEEKRKLTKEILLDVEGLRLTDGQRKEVGDAASAVYKLAIEAVITLLKNKYGV